MQQETFSTASQTGDQAKRTFGSWCRLLAVTLMVGIVWCWILPYLAKQPQVKERLVFLDERGIDPSAMFYTDLDSMEPLLKQLENR